MSFSLVRQFSDGFGRMLNRSDSRSGIEKAKNGRPGPHKGMPPNPNFRVPAPRASAFGLQSMGPSTNSLASGFDPHDLVEGNNSPVSSERVDNPVNHHEKHKNHIVPDAPHRVMNQLHNNNSKKKGGERCVRISDGATSVTSTGDRSAKRNSRIPSLPSDGKITDQSMLPSDNMTFEDTIRKFQQRESHRIVGRNLYEKLTVITDIVDMHRFTLTFADSGIESKYAEYRSNAQFNHLRFGTLWFFLALLVVQLVVWLKRSSGLDSGLPETISLWWVVLGLFILCLGLSRKVANTRRIVTFVTYVYYILLLLFVVLLAYFSSRSVSGISWRQVSNFVDSQPRISANVIVEKYNKAVESQDFDEMKDIAALAMWWSVSANSAFVSITGFAILDAIVVSEFKVSLFVGIIIVAGGFYNFGLVAGNQNILLAVLMAVTVWKVRYLETQSRHEFVLAQKRLDEKKEEDEKVMRRQEALEEKLKLTTEQLKMIETVEDDIVGDQMAELGAWKLDVEQEVQFDKKVAAGAFGIVYLGKLLRTGRAVAVKQLLSDSVNQENMQRFFSEILLHSKLHHPHLVEMIGASWEPPNLCLVLAFCAGGDLKDLLETKWEELKWPSHKLRMIKEVAQAVAYLHSQHIMHRDLKTANVLVDVGLKMRVSDFGESRMISKQSKEHNLTTVGTNFYIAPEVFRGDSSYDFKADVFGFGMIMLALCVKNGSLRDFFIDQMGIKVKVNANHATSRFLDGWRPDLLNHNGKLTGRLDFSDNESLKNALTKFVEHIIASDPKERPSMNEVVKSLDNLDRWICVKPPEWAVAYDPTIILGATVFHPQRGVGSIVSFDGFERVHVLYSTGSDLYRRYSEEGWKAKMSVGDTCTNPEVLRESSNSQSFAQSANAGRERSSMVNKAGGGIAAAMQKGGRRLSLSMGGSKVTPGSRDPEGREITIERDRGRGYGAEDSSAVTIFSQGSSLMSETHVAERMTGTRESTLFENPDSPSPMNLSRGLGMQPSPVQESGDNISEDYENANKSGNRQARVSAPAPRFNPLAGNTRGNRRRSSLIALARDDSFNPEAAISAVLTHGDLVAAAAAGATTNLRNVTKMPDFSVSHVSHNT